MTRERFWAIVDSYPAAQVAVLGDFCLDRYLEIDPARQEISIETGLPVHNITNVRAQPGGAGTILNNLVALGVGTLPIGFAGRDGEGYELWHALERLPGVRMNHFIRSQHRRTFTYCKPLHVNPGQPPVELNRLDTKNWTPTPALLQGRLADGLCATAKHVSAIIVMDQVSLPETGVVTQRLVDTIITLACDDPALLVLADSRRGFRGFPPLVLKMNASELGSRMGARAALTLAEIRALAPELAFKLGRAVFVTLADEGMLGATPAGEVRHVSCLPLRGPIDIVGAGDAVTANLTVALIAGATLLEALEIANAAASIVIHKLGTTGTASVAEIEGLLWPRSNGANQEPAP
jgi:rfaE bifunctional protein kinase chain/domain